jgi:acyl carrier protein
MTAKEIQDRVVKILTPYVKDEKALANAGPPTHILEDLKVNSARLVDVVLAFEDEFASRSPTRRRLGEHDRRLRQLIRQKVA